MDNNFLKRVSLAMAATLTSCAVFAGMDMDSRVSQLETQMKQVRTETELGTSGANTASARPMSEEKGFYLGAGFVYQQARAGGTEFAYSEENTAVTYPLAGSLVDIHYSWDWGLNVQAGYNMNHDMWDVRVGYNYFNQSSNHTQAAGLNDTIVPLRASSSIVNGTANSFTSCARASSQYSVTFNLVDLQIGRAFFVSEMLSFRPMLGVASKWISQKQDSQYTGGTQVGLNTVHTNDSSKFWGIGPEIGMNAKWYIGEGFHFFGDTNASLLYGTFDVRHKEYLSGSTTQTLRISGDSHKIVPTAQAIIGLGYDVYVENNTHFFSIRLGWNLQYYFDQNQMIGVSAENGVVPQYARANDFLAVQGITLDLVWSF
jgi:hypothetical protein